MSPSPATRAPGPPRLAIEDIPIFAIGDILLLRNPSPLARLNAQYQRFRRLHSPGKAADGGFIPTHVALLLGGLGALHSDKRAAAAGDRTAQPRSKGFQRRPTRRRLFGKGVDHISLDHLLDGRKGEDVLLIRHPDIPIVGLSPVSQRLMKRALFYLYMPYNIGIDVLPGSEQSAFCSQYIYRVFRDCGLALPPAPPHHVLPVDFLIWARRGHWQTLRGQAVLDVVRNVKQTSQGDGAMVAYLARSQRQDVEITAASSELRRMLRRHADSVARKIQRLGVTRLTPSAAFAAKVPFTVLHPAEIAAAAKRFAEMTTANVRAPGASPLADISWTLAPSDETEAERRLRDAVVKIDEFSLECAQLVLDDLDAALAAAIDWLKSDESATWSGGTPLPPALERIAFILDLLRVKDPIAEDLEHEIDARRAESQAKAEAAARRSRAVLQAQRDEGRSGEKPDPAAVALHGETLRHLMALHGHSIALDYAIAFRHARYFNSPDSCTALLAKRDRPSVLELLELLAETPKLRAVSTKLLKSAGIS